MIGWEAFLACHIGRFGLSGSNNQVPRDLEPPSPIAPSPAFSRDNHFQWGFGDGCFNFRSCGAERYWTEYGRPARHPEGFRRELITALQEVANCHGTVSITADGGYITEVAIAAARLAAIPFEQIVLDVEGFKVPAHDPTVATRVHRVSKRDLTNFALEFGRKAGCNDAWLALEALHGELSDMPHIYDGTEIRLVNNAYDERRGRLTGPANWSMVDSEQYTAINRHLMSRGKAGIPSILRWSPELMAAQLNSPQWRVWLQASSRPMSSPSPSTWLNRTARLDLCRAAFPGVPMTASMAARRDDPALGEFLRGLTMRLSRNDVTTASQHCWPLDRFAGHLCIDYDFFFGRYREVYGDVAAA